MYTELNNKLISEITDRETMKNENGIEIYIDQEI